MCCMSLGYKIGYFCGDVKRLFDDMKEIKPTLLPTVPRLLDRVYGEIQKKIDRKKIGVFKSVFFKVMYSLKRRSLCNGDYRKQHLADGVVFGQIQAMFGGRLKLVLVGSSPSNPDVLGFMKVVLGCVVIEGYGQTECAGASHTQPLYDISVGNVGTSLQCCETKIIDASELKYYARNNSGELCIRGYNVFQGYYKRPDETKKVLDSDGWLHTGDIVMISTKDNKVSIVDRKNEIFKLSQGEYIVPTKIEQVYQKMDVVSQCLVYGSPYKSFTVAIVVPDNEVLLNIAEKNNITGSYEDLCKHPKLKDIIMKLIHAASTEAQLSGVEKVRNIYLSSEPFTIDNGLLTPTMKIRRSVCASYFRQQIDSLYNTDGNQI
ncbi:hypothetical protein GJ496_009546 [Pomphorhynchus laevis]|nr:hypothetical protein GJ496_009546 [Pomphorhynchus laevis]